MKDKENEINEFQKNIVKIKKICNRSADISSHETVGRRSGCQRKFSGFNGRQRTLSYHVMAAIHKFVKDIHSFGVVTITTKPSHIDLKRKKIQVPHSLSKSVNSIKLNLTLTVDSTGKDTCGCCVLPDGRMACPDYYNRTVRVFETDGRTSFDVKTYS